MPNIRLYWKYFQLKFDFRIHFFTIRNSIEFRISNVYAFQHYDIQKSAEKELQDGSCPNFLGQFVQKLRTIGK